MFSRTTVSYPPRSQSLAPAEAVPLRHDQLRDERPYFTLNPRIDLSSRHAVTTGQSTHRTAIWQDRNTIDIGTVIEDVQGITLSGRHRFSDAVLRQAIEEQNRNPGMILYLGIPPENPQKYIPVQSNVQLQPNAGAVANPSPGVSVSFADRLEPGRARYVSHFKRSSLAMLRKFKGLCRTSTGHRSPELPHQSGGIALGIAPEPSAASDPRPDPRKGQSPREASSTPSTSAVPSSQRSPFMSPASAVSSRRTLLETIPSNRSSQNNWRLGNTTGVGRSLSPLQESISMPQPGASSLHPADSTASTPRHAGQMRDTASAGEPDAIPMPPRAAGRISRRSHVSTSALFARIFRMSQSGGRNSQSAAQIENTGTSAAVMPSTSDRSIYSEIDDAAVPPSLDSFPDWHAVQSMQSQNNGSLPDEGVVPARQMMRGILREQLGVEPDILYSRMNNENLNEVAVQTLTRRVPGTFPRMTTHLEQMGSWVASLNDTWDAHEAVRDAERRNIGGSPAQNLNELRIARRQQLRTFLDVCAKTNVLDFNPNFRRPQTEADLDAFISSNEFERFVGAIRLAYAQISNAQNPGSAQIAT